MFQFFQSAVATGRLIYCHLLYRILQHFNDSETSSSTMSCLSARGGKSAYRCFMQGKVLREIMLMNWISIYCGRLNCGKHHPHPTVQQYTSIPVKCINIIFKHLRWERHIASFTQMVRVFNHCDVHFFYKQKVCYCVNVYSYRRAYLLTSTEIYWFSFELLNVVHSV